MKGLKKTLSMLLLAALVLMCCLPVSLADELGQTADVSLNASASVQSNDEDEKKSDQVETTEPEYPDEEETPVEPETPAQPEGGNESESEPKGEEEGEPQYPGDVEDSTKDENSEQTPDDENAESGEGSDTDPVIPDEEQDEVPSEETPDEEQTEVSDEEPVETPELAEEPEEEIEEEVEEESPVFTEGYATIGSHTTVFETTSVSSEMGNINAGGVVYVLDREGDGESDRDWMEIVFAAVQNGSVEVMHGYVRARNVVAVAENEIGALTTWLSSSNAVEYDGCLLQPLAFTANEVVADEMMPEEADEADEAAEADEEPALDLNELLNPDRHVVMRANWSGEEIHFGDSLELQAMPVGYDNAIYSLQWQTKAVGGEWQDVEGETDCVFTCEVTEDNYLNQWRVLLTVTGVEIVADAE